MHDLNRAVALNGWQYQLALVHWQFFGTATWRASQLGSYRSREVDLWNFLGDFTRFRAYDNLAALPIVVRWEKGELGDRPHAHFVLGGLIEDFVNKTSCFVGMHRWHQQSGQMRLRLMSGSHHGIPKNSVSYLLKNAALGGDCYEIDKFDRADRVCLTPGAWERMCQATGCLLTQPHATF
jgi:hypothetical protein